MEVEPGRDLGSTQSRVPASESSDGGSRSPSGLGSGPRPGTYTRSAKIWDALTVVATLLVLLGAISYLLDGRWLYAAVSLALVALFVRDLVQRRRAGNAGRGHGA